MKVYLFDSPQPMMDALEAAFPSQQDGHARKFRSIISVYGSVEGWHTWKAARAAAEDRLRELAKTDASTAAFLARITKSHEAWRNR